MSAKVRFERKYRLGAAAYHRVLCAIRPYCSLDRHSREAEDGRYLVRSLYFDDSDYSGYTDKVEGVRMRVKYRARAYGTTRADARTVKIEEKTRDGEIIRKLSNEVSLEDFETFLKSGHWGNSRGEALDAFAYARFKSDLKPAVLIQYRREAYFGKIAREARFTFDHDIACAWTNDILAPSGRLLPLSSPCVVFEIKTDQSDADFISRLVRETGLASEPNSKYALAFERACADVVA